MPKQLLEFFDLFMKSGYLMPLVKGTEVAGVPDEFFEDLRSTGLPRQPRQQGGAARIGQHVIGERPRGGDEAGIGGADRIPAHVQDNRRFGRSDQLGKLVAAYRVRRRHLRSLSIWS